MRPLTVPPVLAACLLTAGVLAGCADDATTSTTATTSTAAPSSSTTTTTVPGPSIDCDARRDDVLALVDGWLDEAGLADGGDWLGADEATGFDERTYDAEAFRDHVDLPCATRAVQHVGDDERLALVAWTTERYGFVVQATDAPSAPLRTDVRFELLLERPYGQWLADQEVWATTMEDGTTVVLGAIDMAPGAFAKAWQSGWPPLPDGEPTLESQRHAIAVLKAMGNEGVTIAEEAEFASETGAVMFVTPAGLIAIATVSPAVDGEVPEPWLSGPTTTEDVDGTTLYLTEPGEEQYDVGEVDFVCGDHLWRLHSGYGDLRELAAVGAEIVRADGCEPTGPAVRAG